MRIGPPLLLVGALAVGACASSSGVESTSSFASQSGGRLPGVDEVTATPATTFIPAIPVTTTTVPNSELPTGSDDESFPPPLVDWAEHRLAHLAPTPTELGAGWNYEYGRSNEAEPADPVEAIDGCDAPVPPNLDGFEIDYRNAWTDEEVSIMVGDGTPADSQIWIDAFRALPDCDLDVADTGGSFDLAQQTIAGTDDSVIIAGVVDFGNGEAYVQALGAARVDGIVVAIFSARTFDDEHSLDDAITHVDETLHLLVDSI